MKLLSRPIPQQDESAIWYLFRVCRANGFVNFRQLVSISDGLLSQPLKNSVVYGDDKQLSRFLADQLGLKDEQEIDLYMPSSMEIKDRNILNRFCPKCYKEKGTMHKVIHIERCEVCPDHKIYFQYFENLLLFNNECHEHILKCSNFRRSSLSDFVVAYFMKISFSRFKLKGFYFINEEVLYHLANRLEKLLSELSHFVRAALGILIHKDELILPCEEKYFVFEIIRRPVTAMRSLLDALIRKGLEAEVAIEMIFVLIVCQLDFSVSTHPLLGPDKKHWKLTFTPFSSEAEVKIFLSLKKGLLDIFITKIFPDYDFSSYHSTLLGYPNGEKYKEINEYLILGHEEDDITDLLITNEYLYFKQCDNTSFSGRLMLKKQKSALGYFYLKNHDQSQFEI